MLPGIFFLFAFFTDAVCTGFGRHFLKKQAPIDVFVRCQLDSGIQLFGLLHVVFNHMGNGIACQRHNALIRLLARNLVVRVKGNDETTLAMGVDQIGKRGVFPDDGFRIQFCRRTDVQV